MNSLQRVLKRSFDILGSLFAIIFLLPLLLFISIAVFIESPRNIIFTQARVGLKGRSFRIFKFRSMRPHAIDYQNLREVDAQNPYVTRLGRCLRQYGLDELPQLVNILKGNMSFVGPRPTIQEQVERYSLFQRRRLEVRPGLTGLAQVSGNTSLPWEERIILDVWYIDHFSLWLDLKILFRTITVVLKGRVMGQLIERSPMLPSLLEAHGYVDQMEPGQGEA